ncbi:MAG: hypothetical protein EP343_01290 [Deltaproteobacteria bacterium]|nr:MAG: hypothetical protein EP343_01290 [Deltaproteobacteria bacterium]
MMQRSLWMVLGVCFWLGGCAGPFSEGDPQGTQHLAGQQQKTWKMTKVVIDSKVQNLSDGIKALTRTYFADGTWKDNLANEGVWHIDGDRFFLEETTQKHSPFRKDPAAKRQDLRSVRIVSLKNKLMILEFDNIDIGTGVRGFGTVYLEPVTP